MKRRMLIVLLLLASFLFVGCGEITNNGGSTNTTTNSNVSGKTEDIEIEDDIVASTFSLVNESGVAITPTNKVYAITSGGVYKASGKLEEGQIYVNASGEEVEIELDGVSISSSSVSPIFIKDCSKITIKIKKDTTNYIYDNRKTDYSKTTDDTIGTSAIYVANGDLKVSGKGTVVITSLYNSGIHGKDNVTIKNCTILIKAMNNGIKGNDKVTIEENPTIGIVCGNNGIKTSNSDKGSSAQHGYIYINGGTITINSYGDAIDAAYAVEIGSGTDSEGNTYTPVIDIYTNKYSSYTLVDSSDSNSNLSRVSLIETGGPSHPGGPGGPGGGFGGGGFGGGSSAEKADDSAKGIKANEAINITAGDIFIYTYDDAIHTNNDKLDTGVSASASINISGGNITIKASDDGIHADGTLTITGGEVNVAESHEGLEGNIINIQGGKIVVIGSDDGVNASKAINISGGVLDVTVSPNGDTDGIDSNGTITISGGITIARGPNSEMMAPIDSDGSMKMTGGTLIVIGYAPRKLSASGVTKTSSSNGLSSGTHTVTIGSQTITYNNSYTYKGACTVYGSATATVN
ncbi:MAG: carbohydrate-binding domain-containing protein [Bacilli bacterium]|nr:carbohydrate-binding domain-containing protein [Bacilli bacterium]